MIKNVKELISDLCDKNDKISTLGTELANLKLQAGEDISIIKERIKCGETSGDPIRDLVIVRHGLVDELLEAKYQNFEERLKGNIGQCIMIFAKKEGDLPPESKKDFRSFLDEDVFIGILGDDLIDLNLPKEEYGLSLTGDPNSIDLDRGGAWLKKDCTFLFSDKVELISFEQNSYHILIGEEEIFGWFKNCLPDFLLFLCNVKVELGVPLEFSKLNDFCDQERGKIIKDMEVLRAEEKFLELKIERMKDGGERHEKEKNRLRSVHIGISNLVDEASKIGFSISLEE